MDLYVREMHLGDYDGHAHRLSGDRGITYDHYTRLEPAYMAFWGGAGNWGEPWPPLPEDPNLPCPWASREELEARISELESLALTGFRPAHTDHQAVTATKDPLG
jgi:hypothetical protein